MSRIKSLAKSGPETFSEELVEGYAYQTVTDAFSKFKLDSIEDGPLKDALQGTLGVVKMSLIADAIQAGEQMLTSLAIKTISRAGALLAGLTVVHSLMDGIKGTKGRVGMFASKLLGRSQGDKIAMAGLVVSTSTISASGYPGVTGAGNAKANEMRSGLDTLKVKEVAVQDNDYNLKLAQARKSSDIEVYTYKTKTGTWQNTDADKALWNRVTGKYSKTDIGSVSFSDLVKSLNRLCLDNYDKDLEGNIIDGTCSAIKKHVTSMGYGVL